VVESLALIEINSPLYWELRHQREPWSRQSDWVQDIVSEIIPDRSKVLELGCGQGAFANELLRRRPDLTIVGMDIAPTAIAKAKGLYPGVQFEVADVFEMKEKWKERSFDYIISIQNFEHWVPEMQVKAVWNAWTRLNVGGKFFFTGVGTDWSLDQNNYGPIMHNGSTVMMANDHHYNTWSEQSVYALFQTQKAVLVKFWRRRGKDRVIAEAEK
jgi:SAM-dependent methyltransferase